MSLRLPPPLPPMRTVLGAIDETGRETAAGARDHTVAAVRRNLPARTGRARAGARGRVQKTPTGYTVEVSPSSRVRYPNGVTAKEVTRWLEKGTGVRGPHHHVIRPRKAGGVFALPGGWIAREVQGQAPQHPYARAQTVESARVERILVAGADRAARAAERVLAGGVA